MRPLKLVVSGFGSYGEKEIIDFEKIGNGLFLITGDTGAGKTTIFDAITYALYSETSGGNRSGNMMRSHYAKPDTETYVEFTFSYMDGNYTIRRNPDYEIEKELKNGKIVSRKVASQVTLLLPDGLEYPGKKKEIDEKILDMIGLNVNQFTQIVMLAQGDFLKLLYAKSEERKQIFSKIFHTGFYHKIQEALKDESAKFDAMLLENDRSLNQELNRIKGYLEEGEVEEVIKKEEWDIFLEGLNQKLQELKEKKKSFERKQKEQKLWLEQLEELEDYSIRFDKNRAEWEKQQASIEEKEELLKQLKQDKIQAEKKRKEGEPFYIGTIEEGKRIQAQLEEASKNQKQLEQQTQCLNEAVAQVRQFEEQKLQAVQKLQQLQQKRLKAQEEQLVIYEQLYGQYIRSQAGILAKDLKEGEPCPVCGSLTHPSPAAMQEIYLTKEQLEEQKKAQEEAIAHIGRDIQRAEDVRTQVEKQLQEEEQKRQTLLLEVERLQAIVTNTAKQTVYESVQEATQAIEEATKQLQLLRKQAESAVRALQKEEQEVALRKGRLLELEKLQAEQLRKKNKLIEALGDTYRDLAYVREQIALIKGTLRELDRERMEAAVASEQLGLSMDLIGRLVEKRSVLKQENQVIKNLYQTAGGRIAGAKKMDLETFVQRQFFEQILVRANAHFMGMTHGQYLFRLKEEKDTSNRRNEGLDLQIYSVVTDSNRDVRTLSGGEAFMGALSMALGLSDVVECTTGAVHFEMMFVDEGFGNLDDASREQAIRILNELAGENRIVGIISHVTELAAQIEKQLLVSKSSKGSRIRLKD